MQPPAFGMRREADQSLRRTLRPIDAMGITIGVVLGAGIFVAPAVVATNTASVGEFVAVWIIGGVVSLVGALCYAELASTYPHPGGDYHYLRRALGERPSFLYAWARLTVIPTGSVALLAFVFGDYATRVVPLGPWSTTIYAVGAIVLLVAINLLGIRQGTRAQNLLTILEVGGVACIIIVGFAAGGAAPAPSALEPAPASNIGLALVFVLLTYGGWNEVATLSAEMRGSRRSLGRALLASIGLITIIYVLANLAYVHALGLGGLARSTTTANDLMLHGTGDTGADFLSILIAISALTSANATMITGARTSLAFGRDSRLFAGLGRFQSDIGCPDRALATLALISLVLVGVGTLSRSGFETMVAYTAPIFWLFFLLTGVSLLVLRFREPEVERPFRVPLYPVTPIVFCLTSAYLLYSSIAYTGFGALVGLGVLAIGLVLWIAERRLFPLKELETP